MLANKKFSLSLLAVCGILGVVSTISGYGHLSAYAQYVARPEQLVFSRQEFHPPDPQRYQYKLVNDVKSYLVKSDETHLVNLQLLSRAGKYLEPVGKEGVAKLYEQLLMTSGAGALSAGQQAEQLDAIAAKYSVSVGREFSLVTLNVPSEDFPRGLELMKLALTSPLYQQDRIELAKLKLIQSLKQRNDVLMPLAVRENRRLVYGKQSFVNRLPTEQSIRSITAQDLLEFHHQVFSPAHIKIAVSGDFKVSALRKQLNAFLLDWPEVANNQSYGIPQDQYPLPSSVYVYDKKDQSQVMALLSFPGVRRDDPNYYTLSVLNNLFGGGGFTSRLMTSLREKNGLTYGASSYLYTPDFIDGLIIANFDIEASNTKKALGLYFKELERITTDVVLADELTIAKENIITQYEKKFSTNDKLAFQLTYDDLMGRDPSEYAHFHQRINAVTGDGVRQLAKKYFDLNRLIILLVGDIDAMGLKGSYNKYSVIQLPQRDSLTLKPKSKPKV